MRKLRDVHLCHLQYAWCHDVQDLQGKTVGRAAHAARSAGRGLALRQFIPTHLSRRSCP